MKSGWLGMWESNLSEEEGRGYGLKNLGRGARKEELLECK